MSKWLQPKKHCNLGCAKEGIFQRDLDPGLIFPESWWCNCGGSNWGYNQQCKHSVHKKGKPWENCVCFFPKKVEMFQTSNQIASNFKNFQSCVSTPGAGYALGQPWPGIFLEVGRATKTAEPLHLGAARSGASAETQQRPRFGVLRASDLERFNIWRWHDSVAFPCF